MSRPINITSAVTFNPTGTIGSSNISTSTSYPLSNGYNGTSNTSRYARLNLSANNTSTTCYIYYTFNVNGIPSNATINSVSCTVRIYRNSRVTQNTSAIQLYNGTRAKGSATNGLTTTASNIQIASTGSWTVSELNDIRLRISGVRSSTSYSSYIYFYGADLTVNYTVNGVEYEVTATSEYDGAEVSPSSQFVLQGEDAVVRIDTDTLDNMVLEDNSIDVTNSLQYVTPTAPTPISVNPSSFDSTNTTVTGSNTENGCAAETTTATATFSATATEGATTSIYYSFSPITVPSNATITSITCRYRASWPGGNGTNNAGTTYFSSRKAYLCHGTTKKGNGMTITNTTSSQTGIDELTDTGTWIPSELSNIKLLLEGVHQTGNTQGVTATFWGATLTVNYTVPQIPYYQYTISNINNDHDIVFKQAIIVPPEEDPQKQYFSLTISSINATTEPGRGTIRVESGSTETIKIYPSDPQLTLTTDNGTNISSQLVYHAGEQPTYEVSTAQGASYGFELNNGTGYYVSQNTGIDKSAAVSRIDFDLPVSCLVTFQFINYAEATYDFGVFGNIDATLSNDYYAAGNYGATITDSNYRFACNTSTYNTPSVQTLTYEIPAGQHYIYVKYSKDDASADNNDSLQWKISNIEPLSPVSDAYYEYTLSNINQNHSLIFIFGNVTYYFVTSTHDGNGKLYPDGQTVCLPGDTYKLTIVPETTEDTVTVSDNNVDVTNSLERKEIVTEKNGQTALTVNYVYTITNVQTAHTISVHDSSVVRYAINALSTYDGATVSPSSQNVEEGDDAVVSISVNNAYEIKVKDNGTDVTSSLVAGDGRCTYTINNVQSAHTIVVEEAPYYNVSTSSSYAGVTATANPAKVYAGRSCVITIAGASKGTMIVKDNNADVTNSLVGTSSPYTYTLSNVSASHTITVAPITYAVNASSTFAGVSITPTSSTVIKGNSVTLTINAPNTYSIKVTDNGTVVTGSLTGSANNYKYTISNVTAAHTVVVSEGTYYTITTASTYAGASISAPTKVYAGQSATATITVPNKYEIVFKDNNVDKTSSLNGTSNSFTYTISNISGNHTLSISEASYYTISVSSNYTGATVSASPTKVYVGQTANSVVTVRVANTYEIVLKDNGADKTSSLAGSNGTYTYTISNVAANHTVTIDEATYYNISVSSTYSPAGISANPTKVYKGRSSTITVTGDTNPIIIKDNGTDITSSFTKNGTSLTYTLSNVQTAHTITVSFTQTAFVRTGSSYVKVKKFYKKTGASTWTEMSLSEFQTYINSNDIFFE